MISTLCGVALAVTVSIEGSIPATPDEIAEVILDFDRAEHWFPSLEDGVSEDTAHFRGRSDLPWPFSDRTWTLEVVDQPHASGRAIAFDYVPGSGNVEVLRGAWTLSTTRGSTWVTYDAEVDLGVPIPAFLVRWGTEQVLPEILANLESEVERRRCGRARRAPSP